MNKVLITNSDSGEIGYQLIENANRNNQILSILNECIYQLETAQNCFIDTNSEKIKTIIKELLEINKNNNLYLTIKNIFDAILDNQKDLSNNQKKIYKQELEADEYNLNINGVEIYIQDIPKIEPLLVLEKENFFLILDENNKKFYIVDTNEKDKVTNIDDLVNIELFEEETIKFLGSHTDVIPEKAIKEFLDENPQYKNLPFVSYPQLDEGYPSVDSINKIKDLIELLGVDKFEILLTEMQYNVEELKLPKEVHDLIDNNNSAIDVIKKELRIEENNINNELNGID